MEIKKLLQNPKTIDWLAFIAAIFISAISGVDIVRYIVLGSVAALITMIVVNVLFVICAWGSYFSRAPYGFVLITVSSIILFSMTNNIGTTLFNITFLFQAIISGIACILGTLMVFLGKAGPKRCWIGFSSAIIVILVISLSIPACLTMKANNSTEISQSIYGVPTVLDQEESAHPGTIETLSYQTKAYATDSRAVTKQAEVYLPYGYDASKDYDILYLIHGSGDDETYWLVENHWNKIMLDQLIDRNVIKPLIVVTPTFYVEDDCKENLTELEKLSYSFKDELGNDLIPAAESRYSTYCKAINDQELKNSRTHRAIAGLSRGAVTTLRSGFCGCLDYFSRIGSFSASRTDVEYFKEHIQSDEFKDLSIDYWYLASGCFDFGLASQMNDYKALLKAEPRLIENVNTSIDVYPMRYHSQGNWHLALYNFLLINYR